MSSRSRPRPRPASPDDDALVPATIVCVDCGGRCQLLSHPPEAGWTAGDVVAYRCVECLDRWDVVVPEAPAEG